MLWNWRCYPQSLRYNMAVGYLMVRYPRSVGYRAMGYRISHNSHFLPKPKVYIHHEFITLFYLPPFYSLRICELELLLYYFLSSRVHPFLTSQEICGPWTGRMSFWDIRRKMIRWNWRKNYKNNEEDDLSERIFTAVFFLYLSKSNNHVFPLFDTKKEGKEILDLYDILKPWDMGYRNRPRISHKFKGQNCNFHSVLLCRTALRKLCKFLLFRAVLRYKSSRIVNIPMGILQHCIKWGDKKDERGNRWGIQRFWWWQWQKI